MNKMWLAVLLLPCLGFSQESTIEANEVVIVDKKPSVKRRAAPAMGAKSYRHSPHSDRPRVIQRKKDASSSEVSKKEQPVLENDSLAEGREDQKKSSSRPKVVQRSPVERGLFSQNEQKPSEKRSRPVSKRKAQIHESMFSH
jgi:hypothetical protein